MKKALPYALGLLVLAGTLLLVFSGNSASGSRGFDQRVTLRKSDKIAYGTWLAFRQLNAVFPGARIFSEKKEPGYWDSISTYDPRQALLIVSERFNASEYELKRLQKFAANGNEVFICANEISYATETFFHCETVSTDLQFEFETPGETDSMVLFLDPGNTGMPRRFSYPGKHLEAYFSKVDTLMAEVLGRDKRQRPDFLRFRTGNGHMYLHLSPAAFTNYFLAHAGNMNYYEQVMSYLEEGTQKIVWDEYYQNKKYGQIAPQQQKSWFTVLLNLKNADNRKPFRSTFWLLIGLTLLYVLLEMRRRQRYIPVMKKPANDSLDFVKTVGRLYYEKGDHRNLCHKMAQYFLEHVRHKYKLNTVNLNDWFTEQLQVKSGMDRDLVSGIVQFVKQLDRGAEVSPQQLMQFHRQLEYFYQHT